MRRSTADVGTAASNPKSANKPTADLTSPVGDRVPGAISRKHRPVGHEGDSSSLQASKEKRSTR
ncbi:hypothetical protein M514_07543 [Trichuris suis]|uniref:Uncharacterized protein n=1 Tax=Trichuris suis TaxID=68888 RepID=A0A085NEB4_9BILA|nr:hypothetical protein M513_07543 [Trichuris suis]KFD67810.1 hypothetical protein M514_07543 [Trichuris suis]